MPRPPAPAPAAPEAFRQRLGALAPGRAPDEALGLAVSGGADSLALLLLAARALGPGALLALTVDHGWRPDFGPIADRVAARCAALGVAHETLHARGPPPRRRQADARRLRYRLLADTCAQRGVRWLATAHHADDQAETLALRAARGSGLAGLAGVRPRRPLGHGVMLLRPLLGLRRERLRALVEEAGWPAEDDPANRDPAFDRTHARAALAALDLPVERLATSAAALAEADDALAWAAARLFARLARGGQTPEGLVLAHLRLPPELARRVLAQAIAEVAGHTPRGGALRALVGRLAAPGRHTLGGVLIEHGGDGSISVTAEPARRPVNRPE